MAEPRVAIIGSGFGGLAAGIRLQAAGLRTVMFEARDRPGGRAYVYEDQGFTFDAGPTVITAPHCLEELYAAAGERLEDHVQLDPVRPFYRLLWPDGSRFDYGGSPESVAAQVAALAPEDAAGFERFMDYSRRVFEAGYEGLVDAAFLHFADMVKVAPRLARLRADRSIYAAVSRFVRDERLRQALSFHALLIGGNPFETSAIYTLIPFLERKWGVFFPRGGTGALVRGLADLYRRLGGELRLSSPVARVDLLREGGRRGTRHRVVASGGEEAFDAVVSNADLHHTYARLYAGEPAARARGERLERMHWSMSLVVIYFGTRRRYPGRAHHTILFGPRYREMLREIFHGPALPPDFSLYLHQPTVTDNGGVGWSERPQGSPPGRPDARLEIRVRLPDEDADTDRRSSRALPDEFDHPRKDVVGGIGVRQPFGELRQHFVWRRAPAVHDPVGERVDPPAQRLERQCHDDVRGERRPHPGAAAQHLAEGDDDRDVTGDHEPGERGQPHRAADDQVDVVEPVTQHREAGGDRNREVAQVERGLERPRGESPAGDADADHQRERQRQRRGGDHDPAQLLALLPAGSP